MLFSNIQSSPPVNPVCPKPNTFHCQTIRQHRRLREAGSRPASADPSPGIPPPPATEYTWPRNRARNQRRSPARSEEHTSELQSLMRISYAVFCLKKKNKKSNIDPTQACKQYTHR